MPEEPKTYTEEELKVKIANAQEGLRNDLTKTRDEKNDLEKRLKTLEDDAAKAKSDKEKADLESQGKYNEALEKAKLEYEKKLGELNESITKKDLRISELMVDREIANHSTNAHKPDQVARLIKGEYAFEINGDKVTVKKPDGTPVLDEKGNAATIEYVTTKFLTDNPHHAKASNQGGSGSQANLQGQIASGQHASLEKAYGEALKNGKTAEAVAIKRQISAVENQQT